MSAFSARVGRHTIYFSDHALDRFWERCCREGHVGRKEALRRLAALLEDVERVRRDPPPWLVTSMWHLARAAGYPLPYEDTCVVVNRNPGGDYVAVTTIVRGSNTERQAGHAAHPA